MCENYILGFVGTFRAWGESTEYLTFRKKNKIQPRNKRNLQPLPAQNSCFALGGCGDELVFQCLVAFVTGLLNDSSVLRTGVTGHEEFSGATRIGPPAQNI